jgi:MYXO-CTERM domain-containing protein|nr:DUF2330 domain-containing protein [Kofleriaceae bacterium]
MRKLALASLLVAVPSVAHAFCGFYVAGSDDKLVNDATQVVLMRDGTRTVLAMQNDYKGPLEAFAMVVPVPVVLHDGDVKTLPKDVFEHVEKMGAPRLVEYWEQDPCERPRERGMQMDAAAAAPPDYAHTGSAAGLGVTVEAKFVVGEYQIVILSATDSTGLETWLRAEHYQIPAGAEPLLRPYVEAGMKFFVAKVDPAKVKIVDGHAALSPLRFHYDSEDFSLPIRLGLANSEGTQDLIVNIFATNQRYEVANYKNVTIPTNIDVVDGVRDHFAEFYASLFDATLAKNPGAVVTEYAWGAGSCDPCPGPTLQPDELMTLGADVLHVDPYGLVMTRLHARYGKDLTDDLHFKQAESLEGGREGMVGTMSGVGNDFQARYAIRHKWTGPIQCTDPRRGVWGGPPSGVTRAEPVAATRLAFAPRGQIKLPEVVTRDVPELDIVAKKQGCGCQTSDSGGLAVVAAAIAIAARPRRRRTR